MKKNKTIEGKIGPVHISIEIPSNPKIGLSGREELCEKCGMLFSFEDIPNITMKDTTIPLDIIFLNKDMEIVDIIIGEPESKEIIMSDSPSAKYVLEMNYGFTNHFKISQGDSLVIDKIEEPKKEKKESSSILVKELKKGAKVIKGDMGDGQFTRTRLNPISTGYNKKDEKKYKPILTLKAKEGTKLMEKLKKGNEIVSKVLDKAKQENSEMFLLDHEGNPQMAMEGGERIFSRIHTKELLNLVKKTPTVENLVALGRKMVDIIKKQDTQKPEYVTE